MEFIFDCQIQIDISRVHCLQSIWTQKDKFHILFDLQASMYCSLYYINKYTMYFAKQFYLFYIANNNNNKNYI